MRKLVRYLVARPRTLATVIVFVLLAGGVALAQNIIKLTDGTYAAKVVEYSAAGTAMSTTLTDISTTLSSILAAMSPDATHDSAAIATGPQGMGECDDTSTDAVDEGDAGRFRINCTTRGLVTGADPCSYKAKSYYVVNMNTATTNEIANAVTGEYFHVCSVNLVAAGAQTVSIGEDDTDGCGSITAGLFGGATAATGWSFAANGGISLGNGMGTVGRTSTTARYFCIITGQAQQISGTIAYVSDPAQ